MPNKKAAGNPRRLYRRHYYFWQLGYAFLIFELVVLHEDLRNFRT